jgi:hypothetical protein
MSGGRAHHWMIISDPSEYGRARYSALYIMEQNWLFFSCDGAVIPVMRPPDGAGTDSSKRRDLQLLKHTEARRSLSQLEVKLLAAELVDPLWCKSGAFAAGLKNALKISLESWLAHLDQQIAMAESFITERPPPPSGDAISAIEWSFH